MFRRITERRKQEDDAREQNRLPPGQSLTQKFPVLHYGTVPPFNPNTWNFRIFGLVEEEKVWNWAEFNQLPRTQVTMDIHCVTRWSKFDTLWEGVSLKTLVDEGIVRPKPDAKFVIQHCEQGYTTNTPLDLLLMDNVLLATHFDGKPLDPEHGYPLRVVVGSFADRSESRTAYFWKGGKWLRGLEFRATDQPGFWERNGYNNEADPWQEQRFSYRW
ncbi:MAG: sulfite oxidase-like oxidoreductase [Anaerolineales bacterium]|nr:sulfite oxidase-like oxidoreductase [Anaerolineales bacterium]MCB8952524.1 sulfite oxidase-like oxidoreductase [Ardenticatenales bacterium]